MARHTERCFTIIVWAWFLLKDTLSIIPATNEAANVLLRLYHLGSERYFYGSKVMEEWLCAPQILHCSDDPFPQG